MGLQKRLEKYFVTRYDSVQTPLLDSHRFRGVCYPMNGLNPACYLLNIDSCTQLSLNELCCLLLGEYKKKRNFMKCHFKFNYRFYK